MEVNLHVDENRLLVDDLIGLENNNKSMQFWRNLLARFMVNGDGQYFPEEEAREVIGQLTVIEVREVVVKFKQGLRELQASAVPPATGGE